MEPICENKSTKYLKIPLKSTEQIYLVFLIPVVISCCIYMLHLSADLVVAIQHFRENNPIWGSCTLALIYAPALVYFILTVSRPDWWMTENQKLSKSVFLFFGQQVCQLIVFPIFALYRFAGQLVIIVDAILLSGDERMKSLNIAAAPAAIELYFFLQAWFQAAPQAIFQLHLLLRESNEHRTYQTVVVHVLCIIVSIIVLAMQTASFQRFESQKINGRKIPWATWLKKYRVEELGNLEEKKPLKIGDVKDLKSNKMPNTIELVEDNNETEPPRVVLERQDSVTPPLPPKNAQMIPPPAPLRGITSVDILTVPDMPAPRRPDSLINDTLNHDNNKDTGKSTERIVSIESNSPKSPNRWKSFRLPKRTYSTNGIEEDDPVGKFTAFLWWFFFILARISSIALFFEYDPIWLIGILAVHYLLMVSYLFYHSKDFAITTFIVNLWIALIYIISVIEYRVKFKHADKWLFTYYILVFIQNTLMTVTWFVLSDWVGFWYFYMFCAIFISMGLCIISASVYHVLFKPEKRRIYAS